MKRVFNLANLYFGRISTRHVDAAKQLPSAPLPKNFMNLIQTKVSK
jgi:hypothetical protein